MCISYKALQLSRIIHTVEQHLSNDHVAAASCRAGRACCSQVLKLVNFIHNLFQDSKITRAEFVNLSAALIYDQSHENSVHSCKEQ